MEPSEEWKEDILYEMEDRYRSCVIQVGDIVNYKNFMKAVSGLDNTSSPGYPFMYESPTIGEWLGFNGVTYDNIQIAKLWYMVRDLVEMETYDDCLWRCFIKQEPHKPHKIKSKRYRLIMCPPLHLQVLWQLVFAEQNAKQIDQAFHIPSQQGLSLPYGRWKLFNDQWTQKGLSSGTDATAWDWNFPGWMILLDLEFRKRLIRGNVDEWYSLASKLYKNAFKDCKIIFSDGTVMQQLYWGVMKSGCVNTISSNSHGGGFYHCLYCFEENIPLEPFPIAVGDDSLKHPEHCKNIHIYEKYGMLVKSVSDTKEFVGHEFHDSGPRPMYMLKHIYNLLYQKDDLVEQVLDAYLRLNANFDYGYDFWRSIARELDLDVALPSRNYYKNWYNSPTGGQAVVRM